MVGTAIKPQRFSGYGFQLRSAQLLHEALRMLRVWESQWEDLSYPVGDPRRIVFSSEIPHDWHVARRELQEAVVFHAAMFAGESEADADAFADTPEAEINPFNVARVRLAASLRWSIPREALEAARRELAACAVPSLDSFQARAESGGL